MTDYDGGYRFVVARWLAGEDSYQWARSDDGKFPIEDDVDNLYHHGTFPWEQMFSDRWGRFKVFHKAEEFQHAIQNLGKLAAGARALDVALQVAKLGKPYDQFETINSDNLSLLDVIAAEPAVTTARDWEQDDFEATVFGQAFRGLGLPLGSRAEITDDLIDNAGSLYFNGFDLFVGYLQSVGLSEAEIPKPGLPSGQLEAWVQ